MSTESILQILGIIFAAGIFYGKMEVISRDIKRIENKVERHNSFDTRIVRLESILEERAKRDENIIQEIRATNPNNSHF